MSVPGLLLLYLVIFLCMPAACAEAYSVSYLAKYIADVQTQSEIDVSEIEPGDKIEQEYFGSPVWIYRRTRADHEYLSKSKDDVISDQKIKAIIKKIKKGAQSTSSLLSARMLLLDQPGLEKNPYRSKNNEYSVVIPLGKMGCALQFEFIRTKIDGAVFFDPCTGDQYDSSGRFLDQGAKTFSLHTGEKISSNPITAGLRIPPHRYKSDGTLIIGVADINMLPEISLSKNALYSGLKPTEKLLVATAYNDIEIAQSAIKKGANVNPPGVVPETGSLALLRAVLYSSDDVVELLLSHGAVPGIDEIQWAERKERFDVVKLLKARNGK